MTVYPLTDDTVLEIWIGLQNITKPWGAVKGWFVPADAKKLVAEIEATGTGQFHDVAFIHPNAPAR